MANVTKNHKKESLECEDMSRFKSSEIKYIVSMMNNKMEEKIGTSRDLTSYVSKFDYPLYVISVSFCLQPPLFNVEAEGSPSF